MQILGRNQEKMTDFANQERLISIFNLVVIKNYNFDFFHEILDWRFQFVHDPLIELSLIFTPKLESWWPISQKNIVFIFFNSINFQSFWLEFSHQGSHRQLFPVKNGPLFVKIICMFNHSLLRPFDGNDHSATVLLAFLFVNFSRSLMTLKGNSDRGICASTQRKFDRPDLH